MYKRLSSHLTSLDLPDFPELPDALRETASRMENALHHARVSYDTHHTATGGGGHVASAAAGGTQLHQKQQPPALQQQPAQQSPPEATQQRGPEQVSQSKPVEASTKSRAASEQVSEEQPEIQSSVESQSEGPHRGLSSKPSSSSKGSGSSSNPFKRNAEPTSLSAGQITSEKVTTRGLKGGREERAGDGSGDAAAARYEPKVVTVCEGSSKDKLLDADPDDEFDCLM